MTELKRDVANIISGGSCNPESWEYALDKSEEIIDYLRPKFAGELIQVNNLLPDLNECVLLVDERLCNHGVPDMKAMAIGLLSEVAGQKFWCIFCGEARDFESFTHWMPIPKIDNNQ